MKKKNNTMVYKGESRFFYIAFVSCILSFVTYMYFVSTSVVYVVMRKEMGGEIATLSTTIGHLEAEYIEMQHKVSEDIASAHGFVEAKEKVFIDKTTATLVLSNN